VGDDLGSATALAQRGIGKTGPNALHTGYKITVKFLPARDGSPLGFLKTVIQISAGNPTIRQTERGTIMAFRRRIIWTTVVIGIGLTISALSTAGAQGRRGGVPEPYTPARDATDLKAVLFNWMRNMGTRGTRGQPLMQVPMNLR
jgi:hypothetical protein